MTDLHQILVKVKVKGESEPRFFALVVKRDAGDSPSTHEVADWLEEVSRTGITARHADGEFQVIPAASIEGISARIAHKPITVVSAKVGHPWQALNVTPW